MSYSAESVRYLHIAYAIFIAVQIGYVAWLAARWRRLSDVPAAAPDRST